MSASSTSARRRWRKQKLAAARAAGRPFTTQELMLLRDETDELLARSRALRELPLPGEAMRHGHPANCLGPGKCEHCDQTITSRHDPDRCQLCDPGTKRETK